MTQKRVQYPSKFCFKCKSHLSREYFHRANQRPDGLQSACKNCLIEYRQNPFNKATALVRARQWKKDNRAKLRIYEVKLKRKKPQHAIACRLRKRLYNWIKRGGKSNQTAYLIGCDFLTFQKWIGSQFRKNMKWSNYGSVWHFDHLQPLSSFDLSLSSGRLSAMNYKNLRPVFPIENLQKGSKIVF